MDRERTMKIQSQPDGAVPMPPLVRHLDLFSGIGGFALAAQMVGGIGTVGFCEIDPWAQKVLTKNFPGVPIHGDVKTLNPKNYGRIDLITGGYPCQPFSLAGNRNGEEDDRHLWPELCGHIKTFRPRWVLCENVVGHVSMGLDTVLSDLEGIDYSVQPIIIPACGVGAVHRRERVWILANCNGSRLERSKGESSSSTERKPIGHLAELDTEQISSDAASGRRQGSGRPFNAVHSASKRKRQTNKSFNELGWPTVSPVRRANDGVPRSMDRNRLRGLGNAIVPQVAAEILRCMMAVDSPTNSKG